MKQVKRTALIALAALVGAIALVPTFAGATGEPATARERMRAEGTEPGVFEGEITHSMKVKDANGNVIGTRDMVQADAPPGADCQAACHSGNIEIWRTTNANSPGFTNAFGVTPVYTGSIYPFKALSALEPGLLGPNKHKEIFDTKGCFGCHSKQAAVDRGLEEITGCKDCHEFALTAPGNLHTTHATLMNAEIPLGDAAQAPGTTACVYCHGDLEGSAGNASCWNCHESGHYNKAVYWAPTALPAP
ncbi:MAG: cytochrome c3 family protein [Actinomycetota bacterium]